MNDKEFSVFLMLLMFSVVTAFLIGVHDTKEEYENEIITRGFAVKTNNVLIWSK